MEKTKLGISVSFLGVLIYLSALCGGYIVSFLFMGYVLLFENSAWLKKASVKAFALLIAYTLIGNIVDILPQIVSIINNFIGIFGGSFHIVFLTKIVNIIDGAMYILKILVFAVLALLSSANSSLSIPVIDNSIDKNLN